MAPVELSSAGAEYHQVQQQGASSTSASASVGQGTQSAPEVLRHFVGQLVAALGRLASDTAALGRDATALDEQLQSLTLAEAAIRHSIGAAQAAGRPAQIAVIGPTQTGKSTVVNLLLGSRAAEISPLAGFTIHPQGFLTLTDTAAEQWTAGRLADWRRREPTRLSRDDLGTYSLTTVETPTAPAAGDTLFEQTKPVSTSVVWDTPDFDSLAAREYSRGVLEIAALADAYLLVLSKEKYSDLSVWRWLALLAPLRRPLVICVNKLTPDAEQTVIESLRRRLAERGAAWGQVPIVPLPYDGGLAACDADALRRLGPAVREAVYERLAGSDRARDRAAGVRALIRQHWDGWLELPRAEHQALEEWRGLVRAAGDKFMEAYTRDYLEHPQRYDSFRRATIELLNLLEIPQVGRLMSRARQFVTWPARQLITAGRDLLQQRRAPTSRLHSLGAEAAVLVDALDALLMGLEREIVRRSASAAAGRAVWRALADRLERDRDRLRETFESLVQAHHEQVGQEITATARRLYEELRHHPARLAALRTARASIDVGSLLLAIKTGGLTPLDAIWAPASFAATSLLMEGVTGLEMSREARQLKQRQRVAVQEQFVDGTLLGELSRLAEDLEGAGLLAIGPSQLRDASRALAAWETGDE